MGRYAPIFHDAGQKIYNCTLVLHGKAPVKAELLHGSLHRCIGGLVASLSL